MALPSAVSDYLLQLAREERRPAFLAIDSEGRLSDSGGALRAYGLENLTKGAPVTSEAFFLEGMIPLEGQPIFLPCVKADAGLIADIHIFKHADLDWVVLLDAASHEIQQKIFQQRTNQLSLASERLSQWAAPSVAVGGALAALEVLLTEFLEPDRFRVQALAPAWLPRIWPDSITPSGDFLLPKESSFLDNFLVDAQRFWEAKNSGCLKSGLWSEVGSDEEFFLEACAVYFEGRKFLLIEHPRIAYDEKQSIIQKARERTLELSARVRQEHRLREAWETLEIRFDERTAELFRLNQLLQWEIAQQAKTQEQNRLMLQTLHSTTEMIWVTDLEDRFVLVNPSFLAVCGYSEEEVLGEHVEVVWSERNPRELTREILHEARRGGWKGEVWSRRKDGTEFPMYLSTSKIFDEGSRVVGLAGVAQDLTERKKGEEELARSREQLQISQRMEALGRLAGGIAHDFNNLLTVVVGYSRLILSKLGKDAPFRRELEGIEQAGHRAAELTGKLLAISRKQVVNPRVVDLNMAIYGMESLLRRVLSEDIEIEIALDPQLSSVLADASQIEQVILNLAVNAREAMPSGGKLTLETNNVTLSDTGEPVRAEADEASHVMLSMGDTGCGMDRETQARVFEPFFTTKAEGTGLGLATVYGIVNQAGGTIRVHSEPERGSRFEVCLPRAGATPEASPKLVVQPGPVSGTETILVVEDQDDVRSLVRKVLRSHGYTVLDTGDGEEAMRVAAEGHPIDLILTDVVMPGSSGRVLVEELRKLLPHSKVMYMSGYMNHAVVGQSILDKQAAFLQKPFTPERLAEKVRHVLDND